MKFEMRKEYAFIFLFLIALYLTYPIWLHPSEFITRSVQTAFSGDFLLFRSYVIHFQNFFSGESSWSQMEYGFHPTGMSCRDAECSPAFAVPAGLLSFVVGPVRALNIFMLLYVFLSALAMFYLAKEFLGEKAAVVSATLLVTSNYFLAEMFDGHINLIQFFWMLLAFLFVERLIKNQNWKDFLFLGLVLSAQAYASTQYLLFLALMLPLYIIMRNYRLLLKKQFWKYLLVTILVVGVIAGPYLIGFMGGQSKERDLIQNVYFSVGLPGSEVSYPPLNIIGAFSPISPVYILLPLFFAAGAILLSGKIKAWQLPFLLLSLVAFILSLGPITSFAPYYFLYRFVPFFSSMRTPSRFFLFVVMFLSLIGGGFLPEIEKRFGKKLGNKYVALFLVLGFLIFASFFSPFATAHGTSSTSSFEADGLYEYLGTLPAGTVVEYPNNYNCEYLYHAEIHGKPLFGGCAAFPPEYQYEFVGVCGLDLLNIPDPSCQNLLKKYDIRYVVYHSEKYEEGFEDFMLQESRLKLLRKSDTYYLFEVLI